MLRSCLMLSLDRPWIKSHPVKTGFQPSHLVNGATDHSSISQLVDMGDSIATATSPRVIYQPLHPAVRPLLDPEYVAFHDKYVQYIEPDDVRPWDPSLRRRVNWPYAGSKPVEVGTVRTWSRDRFRLRTFTPVGNAPDSGWPALLWFHGGGWAGGDIDSDNDFCALACREARCVVVAVDYRLAPEHPFPAAMDDAVEAVTWIARGDGGSELHVDADKIALGGASSGANLAAVLAMKSSQLSPPVPITFQILVVPVIDNRATLETVWGSHPHAPWLTPSRMTWYRQLYLPHTADCERWEASPCLAPDELIRQSPTTWMAVGEQDMLSTEGLDYANQLARAGVSVTLKSYAGAPHPTMALNGVLSKGRQIMHDAVEALKEATGRNGDSASGSE